MKYLLFVLMLNNETSAINSNLVQFETLHECTVAGKAISNVKLHDSKHTQVAYECIPVATPTVVLTSDDIQSSIKVKSVPYQSSSCRLAPSTNKLCRIK